MLTSPRCSAYFFSFARGFQSLIRTILIQTRPLQANGIGGISQPNLKLCNVAFLLMVYCHYGEHVLNVIAAATVHLLWRQHTKQNITKHHLLEFLIEYRLYEYLFKSTCSLEQLYKTWVITCYKIHSFETLTRKSHIDLEKRQQQKESSVYRKVWWNMWLYSLSIFNDICNVL